MRFGVALPNYSPVQGREPFLRVCRAAEELGYDAVWVADHVAIPVAAESEHPSGNPEFRPQRLAPFAEAIVALSVAAGATDRITLGTGILVLPLRNPLLTAKMLATLDVLSGGRVLVGAGAGWLEAEFEAVGAPPFAERGAVVEEWVDVLRACWASDRPEHDGAHARFAAVDFRPQPVGPMPILLGGSSPAALRRAGRIGDGWFGSSLATTEVARCVRAVRDHASAAGRDPEALSHGCGFTVDLTDAPPAGGETGSESELTGTPAQVAERIAGLQEAGLDFLELRFAPIRDLADPSIDRAVAMMRRFMEEVVPAVT